MRAFIAITLSQEVKDTLSGLQKELRATGADVKWVAPANIHLTLKFLGEIDDAQQETAAGILDDAAAAQRPFRIRLSSLGAFPKAYAPRVVWAGIDTGAIEAGTIASLLEYACAKMAIAKEERPFSSHITLGRARSAMNRDKLVKRLAELQDYFEAHAAEFPVPEITLYKSTLTLAGPVYETVHAAHLSTA